jgi:hypothetical protein
VNRWYAYCYSRGVGGSANAGVDMAKAIRAGLVFAACGATSVCLADPLGDSWQDTVRTQGRFYSTAELLSPYRAYPSALDVDWLQDRHLLDPANTTGTGFGLGYAWRNMKLEGALVNVREGREPVYGAGVTKSLTTATSRLSYQPNPNLTFQLARGHLSRQSVTDADDDVRRTSIAANYNRAIGSSNWQTILAFGRNTGKTDGGGNNRIYLLESSVRIAGAHTVFARLERASAAELFTERDALYGQDFNANRATLGYVYAIPLGARSQMTFGGVVAKRTMPHEAASILGSDPPAYKAFMRVSLQLP